VNSLHAYAKHWLTLKKQKATHEQLGRNFMPWQMLYDYDFAKKILLLFVLPNTPRVLDFKASD
jgi:hypothetical protein